MSGARNDIDLLTACVKIAMDSASKVEQNILEKLETSAATGLINGLRIIRLQRTILVIGIYSLFESLLQDEMRWDQPFDRLAECLKSKGHEALADRFHKYRLAMNVLKHGEGPSYKLLRKESADLEFQVKKNADEFFFEGDVAEGQPLICVDNAFVEHFAEIVESALAIVRGIKGDTKRHR